MTECEHIAFCLTEMRSSAGSVAAQMLYRIMACVVEKEPALTVQGATAELYFLFGFTRGMAEAPENWTHNGRFNTGLFDGHYLDPAHPSCMLTHLRTDLLKMDAVGAQSYLRDMAECASVLITELKKEKNT